VQNDVVRNAVLDLIDVTGCSHTRALTLFRDSISNTSCMMKAYQCDSWDLFVTGKGDCSHCNGPSETQRCSPMGFRANISLAEKTKVKVFYTVTTPASPFCSKLRIQFTLSKTSKPQDGKVYVTLFGTGGNEKVLLTPSVASFKPGQQYSYYPEFSKVLGELRSVTFYWESKNSGLSLSHLLHGQDKIGLEDGISVIDPSTDEVNVFTPTKTEIDSGVKTSASLTRTYQL